MRTCNCLWQDLIIKELQQPGSCAIGRRYWANVTLARVRSLGDTTGLYVEAVRPPLQDCSLNSANSWPQVETAHSVLGLHRLASCKHRGAQAEDWRQDVEHCLAGALDVVRTTSLCGTSSEMFTALQLLLHQGRHHFDMTQNP